MIKPKQRGQVISYCPYDQQGKFPCNNSLEKEDFKAHFFNSVGNRICPLFKELEHNGNSTWVIICLHNMSSHMIGNQWEQNFAPFCVTF
jgi:hypothetical protein